MIHMAMSELRTNYKDLQDAIDKLEKGVCFACRLVNYDEIEFIEQGKHFIIEDLDQIIEDVSKELNIFSKFKKIKKDRILFILNTTDSDLIKNFARKLYLFLQLYINEQKPAIYMNCYIASIKFPKKVSNNATEIEKTLNMLLSQNNNYYYREYSSTEHDLENIRKSNLQLNLLRQALAKKTMRFAYQPIIDRNTMKIHYYECLLRIPDENGVYISVGPIIPIAENKGLIFIIDQIVLEMTVNELVRNPNLMLAVNISNIGTGDEALWEIAENLLKAHNVRDRLIIEITETSFNQHYDKITLFINKLHKYGCKFALDDFGAGFTSFKQLQSLPIDIIKIDGKYVRSITSDVQSRYFVERLIKISEDLGIATVAEFVENGEIAKCLIDLKVGGLQGNFYSEAKFDRVDEV
ncbi:MULTISPECIES: EAL domain-containing protein [spotted fever group]|uniref:Sensory box/GGDEF family protein n=1 Tax=Rickettsia philipii (strain 364D) TaxID=481009 RepID=H6PSW6_RICP3|nr:EAL domain-containing protein [Rickettsia philipii]AFB25963.1 sensory box/GGDEF family protein [Rickettsia philipii str. 364D]